MRKFQVELKGLAVAEDGLFEEDGKVYAYKNGDYENNLVEIDGKLIEAGLIGSYQMFFHLFYEADTIKEVTEWLNSVIYPVEFVPTWIGIKELTDS